MLPVTSLQQVHLQVVCREKLCTQHRDGLAGTVSAGQGSPAIAGPRGLEAESPGPRPPDWPPRTVF